MSLRMLLMTAALAIGGASAQTDCRTPDGQGGECKSINLCEPLKTMLSQGPTPQQADFVRKSHCGYIGNTPKVCCAVQRSSQKSCFTPDGQPGCCIDLRQCSPLLQRLERKPVPHEVLDHLRRSRCEGPAQYSVCCGPTAPEPTPTPTPVPTPEPLLPTDGSCAPRAALPDPRGGCCGVESVGGNRIIGGNETSIDQYPWMTLVEYRKDNKIKLLCGGALISAKYVLTAGHCIAGVVLRYGTPVSVRLGEYDTNTEEDCVPADGGGLDCASAPVSVPIERTIPHPQYDPDEQRLRRNDIALLRLRTLAPYTEFIRPICLPTRDPTAAGELSLRAAGWGATSNASSSSRKLHVELPYVKLDKCQAQYSLPRRNVKLWPKQLCAGGVKDKDTCKGDSGGPLMYERDSTWELIGVVSFGPTPCAMENVPGVYSNVIEYVDWIKSEVRA